MSNLVQGYSWSMLGAQTYLSLAHTCNASENLWSCVKDTLQCGSLFI